MDVRGFGLPTSAPATPLIGACDITVPECANALTFGSACKKIAAAKALLPHVEGDVQILEEILHQTQGLHGKQLRGSNLFMEVLNTLMQPDTPELIYLVDFLLGCTVYDLVWGDEDDANQLGGQVLNVLLAPGASQFLEQACAVHSRGELADKLRVLRRRVGGDRLARPWFTTVLRASVRAVMGWFSNVNLESRTELLSVNNRRFCIGCEGLPPPSCPVFCARCGDAVYCSEAHRAGDSDRHSLWCFCEREVDEWKPTTASRGVSPADCIFLLVLAGLATCAVALRRSHA